MKVKVKKLLTSDIILSRLEDVTTQGEGQYMALCPAHNDHIPSLSIKITPDNKILLKCFAGCQPGAIFKAINNASVKAQHEENVKSSQVQAIYNYRNADGNLMFQVLRKEPKDFIQRRPIGKGGYIYDLKGVPPILYRLPELNDADPTEWIFVVEGEKDADNLAQLGLSVTTSPMGAGKWKRIDDTPLHGRNIVILPDNDDAGERHAKDIATALIGKAAQVKVLNLPNLPPKGDVSDWLSAGGTKAELLRLVDASPMIDRTYLSAISKIASHGLAVVNMAEVKPEKLSWLWPQRIPQSKLTLLVGNPGVGKSFLTTDIAARISTGRAWPDQMLRRKPGSVIMLSAEDDIADTIRPRLDAAGADVSRIHLIKGLIRPNTDYIGMFTLDQDVHRLHLLLKEIKDVKLIIIDPITAYMGKADSNNGGDVRGVLTPLASLASEFRITVLAVTHLNKGQGGMALYRALGSISYTAAPRAVHLVGTNPEDKEQRLILPIKLNVGKMPPGIAYRIVDGKILWDKGEVNQTPESLLNFEHDASEEPSALVEAMDWLRLKLADGPRKSSELQCESRRDGISWATIRRAKKRIGC